MYNRDCLEEGESILLCGKSDNGNFRRTFLIHSINSTKGSSVICYNAQYQESGIGVLKEFYPMDCNSLTRNRDGQLLRENGTAQEKNIFQQQLDEYVAPYQLLMKIRKNKEIASFIPPFELYYGCDAACNPIGTLYVWFPNVEQVPFEKTCRAIHKEPTVQSEQKLRDVLRAIKELTKCVRELHKIGLVHRDINPSNFGFLMRGEEFLPQTISLFDVNTICSVYDIPEGLKVGTKGYMEAEGRKDNNLTDIYAIGATLFNAIIVTDSTKANGYRYDDVFYYDIKNLVDHSQLICQSETNSAPHLRNLLTRILQKTLCWRRERYQDCEELLTDLQKALDYMIPAELASNGLEGMENLEKIRKALRTDYEKNATLALQYYLYTHPLYAGSPREKKTLDVLVIGCGKYGQKFVDLTLQIAQMPKKYLRVTIVSDSVEDEKIFLADRPALPEFFNVDGSLQGNMESYGQIQFVTHHFSVSDSRADRAFLDSLTTEGIFDAAFVAIGQDRQNYQLAQTVSHFCHTGFSWEKKKQITTESISNPSPVYVTESIAQNPFFAELEQMAFHVHLLWNKNLNIDFGEVKKEFKKPYNHNSCVSFVLALQYKLHGIGMELSEPREQVAKAYSAYLSQNADGKKYLTYLEHRRWVTEKLCMGYTCITDLETCANGRTKDELHKGHICLVRSSVSTPLLEEEWLHKGKANPVKWNAPTEKDLAELDALDRMSVELHLVYQRHAELEKKHNFLNGELLSQITNLIQQDRECVVAFQELYACMRDIWENDTTQWKRYEGLRRAFLEQVKNSNQISQRNQNATRGLLEYLQEKFYPIYASQQFRDYKLDDWKLVEGVAFILTYSDKFYMAMPYCMGNPTEWFQNLAAATVINPSRLLYLVYCHHVGELEAIQETIPNLTGYMQRKKFRGSVEFIIGYPSDETMENPEEIKSHWKNIGQDKIQEVKLIPVASPKEYISYLEGYLVRRRKNVTNFLLEYNHTELSKLLEASNVFADCSSYRYDSKEMRFLDVKNCDVVKYIHAKPYLTVAEALVGKMPTELRDTAPEFYRDYRELWGTYGNAKATWERLCKALCGYSEKQDCVGIFTRGNAPRTTARTYQYILPIQCRKNVAKILDALQGEKIIGMNSRIEALTTRGILLIIEDFFHQEESFAKLFARGDLLMQEDFIRCRIDTDSHMVYILYDNLLVKYLQCDGFRNLLDYFHGKGYLINLHYDESQGTASFTYGTSEIKELLTRPERIREIYVYHHAKASGDFDDVQCGYGPFDCIMTKGFSTIFVMKDAKTDVDLETMGINGAMVYTLS